MIEIKLDKIKSVQIKQPVFVNADSVQILSAEDLFDRVECKLLLLDSITGINHEVELTLWDGQDYIDIGVWTDVDVINRVKELLPTAF